MISAKKSRVIALVDMDCFYVQVVQRKDPSLAGKPCAVVQYQTWKGGGIIAVGYEAREFGVTRQMRGDEAKRKCPEIALVHVPESRGKADLTQFREAGAEVIEVLATFTDFLERASIDEAYMDLTNSIGRYKAKYTLEELAVRTFETTHLVGLDNKEVKLDKEELLKCDLFKQWTNTLRNSEDNYNLAVGAVITDDMRNAVKEKTGFSCSAGVGPNKVLAKVVAGFHKPNQQTLVLPENVAQMFQTTKIRKVRSLGGKLGLQLEEKLKVEFMAELCNLSLNTLQSHVGVKNGELVYWLCRGIDHEPVRPRQLPKSVGCSKNFRGKEMLTTKPDVYKWLTNLVEEVWERLEKEKENNDRVATLFTVGCTNENKQSQSKRCPVIKQSMDLLRDEAFRALNGMNRNRSGDAWTPGLIHLSFTASKFQTTGAKDSSNISKYLSSGSDANFTTSDEKITCIDVKRLSPRRNQTNKALLNYFSVNKHKLKQSSGQKSSENLPDDFRYVVDSNTISEGLKGEYNAKQHLSYSDSVANIKISFHPSNHQKYREPCMLNPMPVPIPNKAINEKHGQSCKDKMMDEDFNNSDQAGTLDDSLPEDPLDFSSKRTREEHKENFVDEDQISKSVVLENRVDLYGNNNEETKDVTEHDITFSATSPNFTDITPLTSRDLDSLSTSSSSSLNREAITLFDKDSRTDPCDKSIDVASNFLPYFFGTSNPHSSFHNLSRAPSNCNETYTTGRSSFTHLSHAPSNRDKPCGYNDIEIHKDAHRSCLNKVPKEIRTTPDTLTSYPLHQSNILTNTKKTGEKTELTSMKGISSKMHPLAPKLFINGLGDYKKYENEVKSSLSRNTGNTTTDKTGASRKGYFATLKTAYDNKNCRTPETLKTSLPLSVINANNSSELERNYKYNFAPSVNSNNKEKTTCLEADITGNLEKGCESDVGTYPDTSQNYIIYNNVSSEKDTTKSNDMSNCAIESDGTYNYATEGDVMSCEMCGKRILVWDLPEHMDFHYAKKIQHSMKEEFLSLYNNQSNSSTPPARKKSKQSNSVTNYFSVAGKR